MNADLWVKEYDPTTLRLAKKTLANVMTIGYQYNVQGQPIEETTVSKEGTIAQYMHYEWNEFGQLTRRVNMTGRQNSSQDFSYDALGRLVSVNNTSNPTLNEVMLVMEIGLTPPCALCLVGYLGLPTSILNR